MIHNKLVYSQPAFLLHPPVTRDTAGSSPIAYALADRGARLLIQRDGIEFANVEWSRKNRKVGRPFIEHQLEIVNFSVALQLASGARRDVQFIHPATSSPLSQSRPAPHAIPCRCA